jgi:2-keto-3-deoxy-L-arabinonate dehydratase
VIGQLNAFSAKQASEMALDAQRAGVTIVSVSAPRLFSRGERDLLRWFGQVLSAIDIPLVIQDFSPEEPTDNLEFISDLHRTRPHFRYMKLEEPLMGSKVEAIVRKTPGEVGVSEGLGRIYVVELIPAGICGVTPSLGVAEILALAFQLVLSFLSMRIYVSVQPTSLHV